MRLLDLTGQTFGKLTVIRRAKLNKNGKASWVTKCECGTKKAIIGTTLRNGTSLTCGCSKADRLTTHGMSRTALYQCWKDMLQRCNNPDCRNFKYYGSRGIKVCEAWTTFETFRDWALSNGYAEDLELDRRNNNRGYFPPKLPVGYTRSEYGKQKELQWQSV